MTHDLHLLTGAYALDALDADERAEFERHLATCPACAEEVMGLRAAAGRLGAAAEVLPPDELRAAVLAEVARTRQLTPLPFDDSRVATMLRRARSQSRAYLLVAAALVVIAGTLGGVTLTEQHRMSTLQSQVDATSAVLSAPDARTLQGTATRGGMTVVASASLGRAVAVPRSLAAAQGRSLQLWVIDGSRFRSVGLLDGDRPLVATGVRGGQVLGVTSEPAGGSKQPTTKPLVTVSL